VHSWLKQRQLPKFRVRYYDGKTVQHEEVSSSEYGAIVSGFYKKAALDDTMRDLLARFLDNRLRYWHVTNEMNLDKRRALSEAIYRGEWHHIASLAGPASGPAWR